MPTNWPEDLPSLACSRSNMEVGKRRPRSRPLIVWSSLAHMGTREHTLPREFGTYHSDMIEKFGFGRKSTRLRVERLCADPHTTHMPLVHCNHYLNFRLTVSCSRFILIITFRKVSQVPSARQGTCFMTRQDRLQTFVSLPVGNWVRPVCCGPGRKRQRLHSRPHCCGLASRQRRQRTGRLRSIRRVKMSSFPSRSMPC